MLSNINKFVGSTQDGSDCAFQYQWGVADGRSLRKKLHKATLKIVIDTFAQRLWAEFGIAVLTIQNLCKRCI